MDLEALEAKIGAGYGRPGGTRVLEEALEDARALLAEVRRLRAELAACREALAEVKNQFFDPPEFGWKKRMLDRLDAALDPRP
jgi:hypothetical protein